jgi:hypothetical protein
MQTSTATQNTIVVYKGRNYRLTWRGPSKIAGKPDRVRLSFLDGSKSFFVDANTLGSAAPSAPLLSSAPHSHPHSRANWPGQECPSCESEPLNAQLVCWECGFKGHR